MLTGRLETVRDHNQISLQVGPQMNKFEQVSSEDRQMSLCYYRGGPCTVSSNASWVMVT